MDNSDGRLASSELLSDFITGHDGLAAWLFDHFGRGSLGNRLPAFAYGMPEGWRAALLEGYVSADGCAIENRRQTSSISKELSLGVRQLAETLGYRAALYCYPQPTDVIEGRTVHTHDQWHVRWKANPRRSDSFAEGSHSWLCVKEVRPARRDVEVFNIAVQEDESYVVEGLVVHNCKDRSRVMRLAGTVNGKTGQYARILEADFQLPPYPTAALVGDLPGPYGRELRGDAFKRARAYVADVFGELT